MGHVEVKLTFTHRWSDGEIADPAVHHVPNLTLTLNLILTLNLTLTLSYLMNRPKHWQAQCDVSYYWMMSRLREQSAAYWSGSVRWQHKAALYPAMTIKAVLLL